MDWTSFRRQMPVAKRWAYLDHAAVSPMPQSAAGAIAAWAADVAENGDVHWSDHDRKVQEVRSLAAQMIGSSPDEIALVRNTTEGVTLVAEGFPWQPGDNVVFPADEFPSNRYAWLNLQSRGVEPRPVERKPGRPIGGVDVDELAAACDGRTRLVAASWVDYATGFRRDLAALAETAHRRGALVFVDAIQALGVFPIDVHAQGIDFLAADGHKWLLGPEGAAVLYVRSEHLNFLRPLGLGWNSSPAGRQYHELGMAIAPTAERYEGGSLPAGLFLGLRESLKLLLSYPAEDRAARALEITDEACRRLTAAGATIVSDRRGEKRSAIVAFQMPGKDPRAILRVCRDNGVAVNSRAGCVRISPHVYNNDDDLARLVAAVSGTP
ncbi:MAG: aminotransferase class V-fold PLP-dependent enzyme [Planctomycetia bacterium]|nr:aminotransferase class V-fold PLP-dependent enzyme [Planctomycetia bacterium]